MPLSFVLSPEGHLLPDELAEESASFLPEHEATARAALEQGDGATLLWLASWKTSQDLPVAAVFWREFAGKYFTAFCHQGGKANAPALQEWAVAIEQAPPMRGAEYLTPTVLANLWQTLDAQVAAEVARCATGVEGWL